MTSVFPKRIDLHMHSTVSDGTDTPAEILENVKRAGIELFSLTDHDAIKGCAGIQSLLGPDDPAFLTGVEFSCKDEQGQYHILGYGYDPNSDSMQRLVQLGHSLRMEKLQARLAFLKSEFGFDFPQEALTTLLTMDNPGKPHIGNLMVKYGYTKTKEEAIKGYIDKLHVGLAFVRPEEAIEGILGGGGIPVLAHPSYGNGDQLILGEEMDRRVRRLKAMGLQGLEAFYSGFSRRIRQEVLGFAEKYELYVTAGSDYHGRNKLVVLGDTGLDAADAFPEGLEHFLDDVRISGSPSA